MNVWTFLDKLVTCYVQNMFSTLNIDPALCDNLRKQLEFTKTSVSRMFRSSINKYVYYLLE